jgi:RpiB/LacA/LacB family sugar-phosphate isomerase|uniref:Cupin type-2 domain-containing protein n=2 Tax=Oryza TaxID=4527 RepID=A0A0E0FMU3_ORYNI
MAAAAADRRFKIFAAADAFGQPLKDAVVAHLRAHPSVADVVDLGVDKYYAAAAAVARSVIATPTSSSDPALEARGVVVCGTGAGVAIFANKYPGVYATHCATAADAANTRSINACNVLALSGLATPPDAAAAIADAWLATPFRAPCPASGDAPWPDDIQRFFDSAPAEMAAIPDISSASVPDSACAICCLRKGMEFEPVGIMPGGEMRIVRESPTSAYVRFKAGSVEPAHHHTFGHDLVVISGKKKVWNLTKKESYDLVDGDFLFTPAGDVHRVKYFEDTEFFIRWDGHWDIFLDEDLDAARSAIDAELGAATAK